MNPLVTANTPDFCGGLVFGFDVGTGSIGWAVRKGSEFKDMGVLICPEDTNDLSSRRGLRRQRRTLRSKKYRRQWFARELAALLGLQLVKRGRDTLPLPETAWEQNANGGWVPQASFESLREPVALRVAAVEGKPLRPEELFTALTHLFRRRGYTEVPWKDRETGEEDANRKKELGEIKTKMSHLTEEMQAEHCQFPCQLLARRKHKGRPQRKEVWPRELLEAEFRAIVAAQKARFPQLAERADWLLFGETREFIRRVDGEEKSFRVFFKSTEARSPGALGLRWPRFENRGPALDAFSPVDEQGRPLHVVRKNKEAFRLAQRELAVLNFSVIDAATGTLVSPDSKALARLRELWESSRRKTRSKKGSSAAAIAASNGPLDSTGVKISEALLKKWAAEFASRYRLVEGQQPLTPQTGAGRARFASPTLGRLRDIIASGQRPDVAQPVLRRADETAEPALNRYLAEIKHPLVRHRLILFRRLLADLVKRFGPPNLIVLEAVRSLALSEKNKRELQNRIKTNRDERASIREELASRNASTSRKALLRYRLWKEAQSTCPFCGEKISQEQLLSGGADIEHLVPRSVVDCNEFYNLTVGHLRCNREIKGDRTPYQAFAHTERWPRLRDNAEKCFKGRKLEIFLSNQAEELIERKADLQHTAYIARVIRHVALIQLGWLGEDGRDPTMEKGNKPSSSFQVTNGQLTSRLRQAWGLNHLLHPLPHGVLFHELPPEQQKQFQEKNRGDLRHHALDAMVIACTLPWLAHRTHGATDEFGNHGWWTQDEKQRSKAANPVFPQEGALRRVAEERMKKVVVRHHVSRSPHGKKLDETLLSKRLIDDKNSKREVFVARKPLRSKTPDALSDVFSTHLREYLVAAWKDWEATHPDWDAENKGPNKGKLPPSFIATLRDPIWRTPVESVKFVVEKSRTSVFKVGEHPTGERREVFVGYGENQEVRVFQRKDGKGFVALPIRPCYPAGEQPSLPHAAGRHAFTLRRGSLFRLKPGFKIGNRELAEELYRVVALPGEADARLSFFAHYQNQNPEKGVRLPPLRADIVKLAPFLTPMTGGDLELPHPPSPQPPPAGPDQAGPVAH